MNHLTRNDYAGALQLLAALETESGDAARFGQAAVVAVSRFVACELATLSVCNLATGQRKVLGVPGQRLSAADIECFDRHFFDHPLVRRHGFSGGRTTVRISDVLGRTEFRRTALYADYYRKIGLEHTVAVPLFVDERTLASIVLNRRGLDFSERDCERLEVLRPHLSFLYCQAAACATVDPARAAMPLAPVPPVMPHKAPAVAGLTLREQQVMQWLSGGKTDAEIAALLSISPRTVHKHLEHIYVKLGVETRTAAVMRLWPPGPGASKLIIQG
jgi:DNA-binding CsgD family transcriptional regulator